MNNLFPKMPKSSRKKHSQCDRHDFSLKPRSQYTFQPQYFHVSFCSKLHGHGNKKDAVETAQCLNCPRFNKDANFATPTFVLTSQQGLDGLQGERMREDHERRMVNYTDEKSSMNVAKPRSKNNYCSVCRNNYNDYLEHIESPLHKKKINACEFNKHIIELTQKFKQPQPKHKQPLKTQNRNQPEEDDSVEIISNPNKRIKPNETLMYPSTQMPRSVEFDHRQTTPMPYYPYLEQPAWINEQRAIPSFHEHFNHYNFSINMNLYLNSLPQYPDVNLGGMNLGGACNPYLNVPYQSMLFAQLNQLSQNIGNPYCPAPSNFYTNEPKVAKPTSYIIIDED